MEDIFEDKENAVYTQAARGRECILLWRYEVGLGLGLELGVVQLKDRIRVRVRVGVRVRVLRCEALIFFCKPS